MKNQASFFSPSDPKHLLVATRNRHKLDEIRALLGLAAETLTSGLDYPDFDDVEEDGDTFEANAVKKARVWAERTGAWCLADDSGLEVDALEGAPGVYSARYAGEPADYAANNRKLLAALDGVTDRRARFRCVMALADPKGHVQTVEGRCEGRIAEAERGTEGFGYDPLFIPEGHTLTFAELPPQTKNSLSHRGHALRAALEKWWPSNPPPCPHL